MRPFREGGEYERASFVSTLLVIAALAGVGWLLVFGLRDCARAAVESAKPKSAPLSFDSRSGIVECDVEGCDECFGPSWSCDGVCDLPGAECVETIAAWRVSCGGCEAPWVAAARGPGSHFEGCPICELRKRVPRDKLVAGEGRAYRWAR